MTYLGDLLAHGLDALERLLADVCHLVRELSILLALAHLLELLLSGSFFLLLLLFYNVLQECNLTDLVAVVVDDISVVINLETNAVAKVASGEAAHNVTILIADLTLLVDTAARHGVDAALLLFRLPTFGLTNQVTILVDDLTLLVDLVAQELLDIPLNDAANDAAIRRHNVTFLGNCNVVEASEWSLGGSVDALHELSASDDVAGIVPDLALAVNLATNHLLGVSLSNAANNGASRVDNIASLVDSAVRKSREILGLLLLLLPWLGVALDVSEFVDDVAILVDREADQALGVTVNELANDVAIGVLDLPAGNHAQTLEASERSLGLGDALVLGNELAAANDLASVAVDQTVLVAATASKLRDVALNKLTKRDTALIDNEALLVQDLVVQDGQVGRLLLGLLLEGLGMALHVAVLVDNISVLIDR